MSRISANAAYQLLTAAGFTRAQAITMTAIGMAESGLNPDAVGDTALTTAKWGPSVGVWQIRTLKAETGRGTPRDINHLRGNPRAQAAAAHAIFRSQGFGAWSVFKSGSYKSHLGTAQGAAGARGGNGVDPGPTRRPATSGPTTRVPAATGTATATPVGLGWDDLNPLNWPGALGGGFGLLGGAAGDVAGDVAGGVFRSAWAVLQPFALTSMFAVGGIALVVGGAFVLSRPMRESIQAKTQQTAQALGPLAMAV